MSAAVLPAQRRSRLHLILLAALFAAPVVGAWLAWQYVSSEGVSGTTNAGVLVAPAHPVAPAPWADADGHALGPDLLKGRWTYVQFAADGCDAACSERLYLTRQVRTSVNKDMSRVHRVLMVREAPADLAALVAEHPDLQVVVVPASAWASLVGQFAATDARTLFLVDPLGNLMMRYDPQIPARGMLKDLRKLLKVSQVG